MEEEAPELVNVDETDANNPGMILMCHKCNNVVADSLAWVGFNSELHSVTVDRVTKKVRVKEKLSTSGEGPDIGSTFTLISCIQCDSKVGRVYKTTPRHMDEMRDLFTLDVNALECYQMGGPDVQAADRELNEENLLGFREAKMLATQMNKMESVILALNERLTKLEKIINSSDSADQPSDEEDKENLDESGCEMTHSSTILQNDDAKQNRSPTVSPRKASSFQPHKSTADVKRNIHKHLEKRKIDLGVLEMQRMHKKTKK